MLRLLVRLLDELSLFLASHIDETGDGAHFADILYLYVPTGCKMPYVYGDDDNLPCGTLVGQYKFMRGHKVYRETP